MLEAWLPGGEAGGAVASVLFGEQGPSGRLPISRPRSAGRIPVYDGHKPSGGRSQWKGSSIDSPAEPLFPSGHGLSHTRLDYSNLCLGPREVPASGG